MNISSMPAGAEHSLLRGAALAGLIAWSAGSVAAPVLHPLFSDHAVLQREMPITIWGSADAGEPLSITFAGIKRRVRADNNGRWKVQYPAKASGGPFDLIVTGEKGTAHAEDIFMGDVWLCSGQSNMEFPVSRSLNAEAETAGVNDSKIRLFTVPKQTAAEPSSGFSGAANWSVASPKSIGDFSAACYFMVRDLRASAAVPIGAINASWGGTAIRSWLDLSSSKALGGSDTQLLRLYKRDPAAASRQFGQIWQSWWLSKRPERPWQNPHALSWTPMPKMAYWETWGAPAFANFNGMVWARKTVTLSPAEAAQGATLSLGVIDELDQTWVNGVPVGSTFGWEVKRDYTVPAGGLRAGENEILVNLFDSYAFGGFQGPSSALLLRLASGSVKQLGEGWSYAVAPGGLGDPPRSPWDSAAGVSLVYNGLIAPLTPFRLKGVAWYQGESDTGLPDGYREKLSALMSGWRRKFHNPDLPFLVVTLANFGAPPLVAGDSGWAEVRNDQRLAVEGDANAALVVTTDVGDRLDLHPPNKQEVGKRLARAARAKAYKAMLPASGPQIKRALRSGKVVTLEFQGVTGKLRSWGGRPVGFELCGTADSTCRFVTAEVTGRGITITPDGRPASRVRYAWSDAPVVNVYDEVPLPLGPFEALIR